MATKKTDKYADFKYVLTPTELAEAKWLIEQGDFKDLEEFIEGSRKAQIWLMKRADAEKRKKVSKRVETKRSKAA